MTTRPFRPSTHRFRLAALALAAVAVTAGCSSSKKSASGSSSASSGASSTTPATTAAPTTTPTTAAPDTTAAPATTVAATAATVAAAGPATTDTPAAGVDPWTVNATAHRGQNGSTYSLACPPGGTAHIVWGTETYTDDSSVCTAAVHVGLITLASGGTVQYRIAAGLASYSGTVGHGVTTESYGVWNGSFIFPAAPPGSGHFAVGPDSWSTNATTHRGQNGTKVTVPCSPNGTPGSVYGTGTYTDDSSVCTAAVHVGLITLASGGTVQYRIAAGLSSYAGTVGHGVTTESYGVWNGSFIFPAAPPGSGHFAVGPDSWSTNATTHRGQNGTKVTVPCSPNGTPGSVYGTGTYTDDSSVCTAAVQAGLITVAQGGTVVIQIAAGQSSYTGSTANGVTSSSYGSWGGSYTFPKDQTPA